MGDAAPAVNQPDRDLGHTLAKTRRRRPAAGHAVCASAAQLPAQDGRQVSGTARRERPPLRPSPPGSEPLRFAPAADCLWRQRRQI